MENVKLTFSNGTVFMYELINDTKNYITFDDMDATSMRYSKDTKELFKYDPYTSEWNKMINTTKLLTSIEII